MLSDLVDVLDNQLQASLIIQSPFDVLIVLYLQESPWHIHPRALADSRSHQTHKKIK